ncbi:DUF397 domain-containing protein [Saccharopolyspora sp. ASAGF58]|uniref:DUF397 domain-containing protein n=1 Tax=Saccharopolyspora sp. ASAGF58 TaxID=2719023 RepID=UPI00143FEA66|nr:DUF397 domain-containing protein [Saccharopolyspora sp. ASAGF58]
MTYAFASWRKSTYSGHNTGCVEVGSAPGLVGVRDTKDRDGGTLAVSRGLGCG